MYGLNRHSIAAFVLTQFFFIPVIAAECERPAAPEELSSDDTRCLDILMEKFASYSPAAQLPEIKFRSERNRLLLTHYQANYKFVIDSFYFKYCELVSEPRWELSTNDQHEKLDIAKEELYARVPFGPRVVDTQNVAYTPFREKNQGPVRSGFHGARYTLASFAEDADMKLMAIQTDEPSTSVDYLRDVPFVVTEANKYFVMVASVRTLEDAQSEAARLKRKAPQFDFVAYAPYKGNPSFAIMMATWVPRSVAEAALAEAKEHVSSGSIIWKCRQEGDRC